MKNDIRNLRDLKTAQYAGAAEGAGPSDLRDLNAGPFRVQQSSSADNALLSLIRSDDAVRCFGGCLFRRDNPRYGHVICFAVENMRPEDAEKADKWYTLFGRMSHLGILHRTPSAPITAGNYTVFEFVASAHDKSIREHLKGADPMRTSHNALMSHLVSFIHSYSQELKMMHFTNYIPLCCLSQDTVLLDSNGRMKILPLRAYRGNYSIEIPQEVSVSEHPDEKSDLYSAAYLAVKVYSKNRGFTRLTEPDDSAVICNCLKAVHDWRPSLDEVYAEFSGNAPQSYSPREYRAEQKPIRNIQLSREKLQGCSQKIKNYFQQLVRPYELEESETFFERDGTVHENSTPKNEPLDMGGGPDSTFGSANR